MARGITQDDVWKACDALLLEGERPTIERVRQKIGRGSPNTVSPFLDAWFKHLGGRIKDPGAFAAPPDLPDPIHQAAKHFWEAALAQTRLDFDDRLREGLAAAAAHVEAEKERADMANAAASDASAKATHLQADLARCEAALKQEKDARAGAELQLLEMRHLVDDLRGRLERALADTATIRAASQKEVSQAIERFTAAERRAALEIDTERSARSKSDKRAEALERRLESAQAEAQKAQSRHVEVLAGLQAGMAHQANEVAQIKTANSDLERKLDELSAALLQAQREAHAAKAESALAERVIASLKPPATPAKRRTSRPGPDAS